jgi:hypothetical protein
MDGNNTKPAGVTRTRLVFSEIEDLRRNGHNQSEIAEMHGVSRQAVSWQKHTYGGHLTPRQVVNKSWPWQTTVMHGKAKAYQRLRDHGEFMVNRGFHGMSDDKIKRLKSWWRFLRENDVVLEFDPAIPPTPGVAPHGGFRYVSRPASDENLLIRINEHTNLTEEGKLIWCWPRDIQSLI